MLNDALSCRYLQRLDLTYEGRQRFGCICPLRGCPSWCYDLNFRRGPKKISQPEIRSPPSSRTCHWGRLYVGDLLHPEPAVPVSAVTLPSSVYGARYSPQRVRFATDANHPNPVVPPSLLTRAAVRTVGLLRHGFSPTSMNPIAEGAS